MVGCILCVLLTVLFVLSVGIEGVGEIGSAGPDPLPCLSSSSPLASCPCQNFRRLPRTCTNLWSRQVVTRIARALSIPSLAIAAAPMAMAPRFTAPLTVRLPPLSMYARTCDASCLSSLDFVVRAASHVGHSSHFSAFSSRYLLLLLRHRRGFRVARASAKHPSSPLSAQRGQRRAGHGHGWEVEVLQPWSVCLWCRCRRTGTCGCGPVAACALEVGRRSPAPAVAPVR